eukprot:3937208-Rhodomonas_salina.5
MADSPGGRPAEQETKNTHKIVKSTQPPKHRPRHRPRPRLKDRHRHRHRFRMYAEQQRQHSARVAAHAQTRKLQTQIQETAFLVQIVLKMRFLVLDFGIPAATPCTIASSVERRSKAPGSRIA